MNLRKFTASTPREALRAARVALGDDAVVLSNRAVAGGTELMVLAPDDMNALLSTPASGLPNPSPVLRQEARDDEVRDELRSMRGLLESQLATLAWNGRQPEARARALREMLAAGFSAGLSRYIAERMPLSVIEADDAGSGWLRDILGRNLLLLDADDQLLE